MDYAQRQETELTPGTPHTSKPLYEPPSITIMTDEEVLTAFQITPAATSWWGNM